MAMMNAAWRRALTPASPRMLNLSSAIVVCTSPVVARCSLALIASSSIQHVGPHGSRPGFLYVAPDVQRHRTEGVVPVIETLYLQPKPYISAITANPKLNTLVHVFSRSQ